VSAFTRWGSSSRRLRRRLGCWGRQGATTEDARNRGEHCAHSLNFCIVAGLQLDGWLVGWSVGEWILVYI
jgi:hypothetical protein